MKAILKINFLLLGLTLSYITMSQTPQAFKYQTVVRDFTGDILQNQNVSFRFHIHDMNPAGTVVYSETHSAVTNEFGLVSLNIGSGVPVLGSFSAIDWGSAYKFLETELDPAGGSSYTSMGTSQLLSVPYSLYSENTANNDDADADPDNELQTLAIDGNNLSISDGNTVTLPGSGINNRISDDDGDTWIDVERTGDNDSIIFTTFGMERMKISNNGYVEVSGQMSATGFIGDGSGLTGIPSDDLGDHTATQNIELNGHRISNDGDEEGITVTNEGNVGINNTFPDQRLTVDGNIRSSGQIQAGFGTANNASYRFGSGYENTGFSSPNYNSLSVITNGSERISVNQTGNVGIGTSNPQATLDVNGQVVVSGQIQIAGGDPGENKVLMSDATGLAFWSLPQSNGGGGNSMATSYMIANNMFTPHANDCTGASRFVELFDGAGVGFCIDMYEQPQGAWLTAVRNCLSSGKRLPEPSEWQLACWNSDALGLIGMTGNWEWVSNFPVSDTWDLVDYGIIVPVSGQEVCEDFFGFLIGGSVGYGNGAFYRCVR